MNALNLDAIAIIERDIMPEHIGLWRVGETIVAMTDFSTGKTFHAPPRRNADNLVVSPARAALIRERCSAAR